jgi:hypothetical protein
MTPRATVIIPTHNHGPLVRLAVESALRQSEPRLEVIIVGDGATPETAAAAAAAAATDNRVRFMAFPKAAPRGEPHRHAMVQEARGEIVCYLCDDDLWTSDHVATMLDLLGPGGADFAMTLQVRPMPAGGLGLGPPGYVDLALPLHRRLCAQPTSGFANGLSCVAHTTAFYRSLPFGWRPAPPRTASDGWMWKQCLTQPGVRAISRRRATALHLHSPVRRYWPIERRLTEMRQCADTLFRGGWDRDLRRLERESMKQPPGMGAVQWGWEKLHRTRTVGYPLMRLAYAVFNRPAS